jgi:hypothetical protein
MQTNTLTNDGSILRFRPITVVDASGRIIPQNGANFTIPPNGIATIQIEIMQESWLMYILRAPFRLLCYLIWK